MPNSSGRTRSFKYSIDKLIELVKDRPALWDNTRADFRCFYKKEMAWWGVYEALAEEYNSANPKTQAAIGVNITSKWRNIRDTFIRSVKKQALDNRVKKYMYHDQLSFMLKTIQTDNKDQGSSSEATFENITERNESIDDDYGENIIIKNEPEEEPEEHCNSSSLIKMRVQENVNSVLKHKTIDFDEEIPNAKIQRIEMESNGPVEEIEHERVLNNSANNLIGSKKSLRSDEDQAFFQSTLSMVKDMNDEEKLEFRMGVLQQIHKMRIKRQMSSSRYSNGP